MCVCVLWCVKSRERARSLCSDQQEGNKAAKQQSSKTVKPSSNLKRAELRVGTEVCKRRHGLSLHIAVLIQQQLAQRNEDARAQEKRLDHAG